MVCLAWLVGARPKELQYLSACDMHWHAGGVRVAVNRTKNDAEGYKRVSDVDYGEDAAACALKPVWSYAVERNMVVRAPECTQVSHPTLECEACPRFFQNVLKAGVVRNNTGTKGMPDGKPNEWVHAVFDALAADGLLVEDDEAEGYTARSCRAGTVSAAAAGGVRKHVAAEHVRMRAESTLLEYDRVLEGEVGATSRALQGRVSVAAQDATRGTSRKVDGGVGLAHHA
jgi:hypothetical protein